MGDFGDVLPNQSVDLLLMKISLEQSQQFVTDLAADSFFGFTINATSSVSYPMWVSRIWLDPFG